MCGAIDHARFTPNSDRKSDFRKRSCLLYPPKADMCGAVVHVCYGPKADIKVSLSHRTRNGGRQHETARGHGDSAILAVLADRFWLHL